MCWILDMVIFSGLLQPAGPDHSSQWPPRGHCDCDSSAFSLCVKAGWRVLSWPLLRNWAALLFFYQTSVG